MRAPSLTDIHAQRCSCRYCACDRSWVRRLLDADLSDDGIVLLLGALAGVAAVLLIAAFKFGPAIVSHAGELIGGAP
ncbi:MAG TPA: hypothetical protein VF503_20195 [Sphingobium sp.]|uniref:hypothetical protein n=1 Tax=Sphingobium sp. TaxID=1912891 RepID=UPI002ED4FB03